MELLEPRSLEEGPIGLGPRPLRMGAAQLVLVSLVWGHDQDGYMSVRKIANALQLLLQEGPAAGLKHCWMLLTAIGRKQEVACPFLFPQPSSFPLLPSMGKA